MKTTIKKLELRVSRMSLGERPATYQRAVHSSADVARIASPLVAGLEQEVMLVFHLDSRNRIVGYHEAGRGSISGVAMPIRDLLRTAIVAGAVGVILAHNHPSGDPSPSNSDVEYTRQVIDACKLLGIAILDHVIIGADRHASLLDLGIMQSQFSDTNLARAAEVSR